MDELGNLVVQALAASLDDDPNMRRTDFARLMNGLGFQWTGNTVTQVVTGRRGLSLSEVAGICQALHTPLSSLVSPIQRAVLPSGTVRAADMISSLKFGESGWLVERTASPNMADEATEKAAHTLGISAAEVEEAAGDLWGTGLSQERDRRAAMRRGRRALESRRSLQALRGHVTRTLLDELRAHLSGAPI